MPPPYEILSDDKTGNVKRSVNVRIKDRLSADDVNAIADEIHGVDENNYERTFIGLYLPHQKDLEAGCWATAHSNPEREIKILGMTAEIAAEFAASTTADGQNAIGRWIDDAPNVACAILIYESDSNYFMTCTYGDGSSGTNEMNLTQNGDDREFRRNDKPDSNDYWLVRGNGSLEIRDNDGLISTPQNVG